ncbi:TetR family transcriptional regulator [Paenibacillus sp. HN-1]|uniref:TetR family transcriptional regulator n=1 Tax=Paenibacillus TaxID=44249 RepID=UPI001CA9CE71|nr:MULTISPECIES: TetR family transcriptional regulator [Paenibacillus]MBY9081593.1 TetR family transcriptional regulator [Paenibacillus sp. CGMCC 1.18879]MBY9083462.1 TetR family transcriptional regulator [Paenibacillus sinensis]
MAKRAMTPEAKALKAQAILDKAAEMFLSSEYEKIKMSDIAKQMGMSNGILFVYFKTKEALFFSLLCREYEKRLARLTEMVKSMPILNFDDFKMLVINELTELVDHNPLYIRLESMRTAVFEKNVDAETMLSQKMNLYKLMSELVSIICSHNALTQEDVMDILQAEASIITGCKLSATLPVEVIDIIEKNGLDGLKRDFKDDVLKTIICYLDGYLKNYI